MWSFQKSDWCQDLLFLRLLIFIDLTLLEHYFILHQLHNEIKEDSSGWWGHRVGQTPSRPHNEELHHDKVLLGGFVIRVLLPPVWLRISSHSFAPDDPMNLSFSSPALPFETTVYLARWVVYGFQDMFLLVSRHVFSYRCLVCFCWRLNANSFRMLQQNTRTRPVTKLFDI